MTGTDTVDEDGVRRFLTENRKYAKILRMALEQEEKHLNQPDYVGWEWHEVGASPQELRKLVTEGIVTRKFSSKNHKIHLLSNREAVKKALESVGEMRWRECPDCTNGICRSSGVVSPRRRSTRRRNITSAGRGMKRRRRVGSSGGHLRRAIFLSERILLSVPTCPYCGSSELEVQKSWRFRFYNVTRYKCRRCGGIFNHYANTSGKGKREFYIRVRQR